MLRQDGTRLPRIGHSRHPAFLIADGFGTASGLAARGEVRPRAPRFIYHIAVLRGRGLRLDGRSDRALGRSGSSIAEASDRQAVVGSSAVARFVLAITQRLPPDASVEEIELNGAPGLVAKAGGRIVVVIMIDTDGERIHSVFAVSNPDKLDAMTPAETGRAIGAS
jgi:hypothetical protein